MIRAGPNKIVSPSFGLFVKALIIKIIKGNRKTNIDQVIWKLITPFATLLISFILSFFDTHIIIGTMMPRIGKNINVRADKFNNFKKPVSSFIVQSISSSGLTFSASAILLNVSPVGSVSPFSIRWIVLKLSPEFSVNSSWDKPFLFLNSFTLLAKFLFFILRI